MVAKLENKKSIEIEEKRKKKFNAGAAVTAALAGYSAYKIMNLALPYKPIPQITGLLFASMTYNWLTDE